MMIHDAITFEREGSREWDRMWKSLGELEINRDLPDPTVCMEAGWGEAWQYLCTVRIGKTQVHEFRHRCHPTTGEREYVRIPKTKKGRIR